VGDSLGLIAIAVAVAVVGIVLLRGVVHRWQLKRRYGTVPASARLHRPGWQTVVPVVLLLGAVASLAAAFKGFEVVDREVTQGVVLLTMDVSNSMLQTDVEPDRLAAAVDAAQGFLEELPQGFRVGVVTFANEAQQLVPPTLDRARVSAAIEDPETARRTVIGDGLARSLTAIESDRQVNGEQAAAVVLLTDGRDTGSLVTPEEATDRAVAMEVPVFTVALGAIDTEGGANTELLEDIATSTGGATYTAQSASELNEIYDTLGSELSRNLAITGSSTTFVLIGAILAVLAGLIVLLTGRKEF
jgi:Ca-activated chloride channel homolog